MMRDGQSIFCRVPTMEPSSSPRSLLDCKNGARCFVLNTTCKRMLARDCGMGLFSVISGISPRWGFSVLTAKSPRANAPWAIESRPVGALTLDNRRRIQNTSQRIGYHVSPGFQALPGNQVNVRWGPIGDWTKPGGSPPPPPLAARFVIHRVLRGTSHFAVILCVQSEFLILVTPFHVGRISILCSLI